MTAETAEDIAVQAFSFVAADPERLERFLSLTGIGASDIRAAASEPGFMLGVMEYIASDDTLVGSFVAEASLSPTTFASAHAALGGTPWEREFP